MEHSSQTRHVKRMVLVSSERRDAELDAEKQQIMASQRGAGMSGPKEKMHKSNARKVTNAMRLV